MSTDQFFLNATLGLNQWWRWVLGLVAILLIWIVIGSVALLMAGCALLKATNAFGLSCSGATTITGDSSLIAQIALGGSGFGLGLIGIWIVVRLIHKKNLMQVVTGRASFDFKRFLYAMLVALFVSLLVFLANRYILQLEMTFQKPNWEYLLFLLFAIVFIPIQSGFEEVFFRGYILQGIMLLVRNKLVLAILSGVVFALPHLGNPEPWSYGIVPYVVALASAGFFFTLLTLLDGGIELAWGYHAVNNLFLGLIANTEISAINSPSLFVIHIDGYDLFPHVFMDVLSLALAVVILNHRYKWFKLRNT